LIYLLIEFLDELVFGVHEAAWPLIRDDLALTYAQIGILLSLPGVISSFIEPFMGILGDVWKRRVLILGGGIFFVFSLVLTSSSPNFSILLLALILFNPASGAFVSLSQATLMDVNPNRHEQNMARWTFAGSVGVVGGPLLLGVMAWIGFGWRSTFLLLAVLSALVLFIAWTRIPRVGNHAADFPSLSTVWDGLKGAFSALKTKSVLRWLVLLEFADLMMDVLLGFLALYFVDVVGLTGAQAVLSVAVWTGVGLLGDFLLIPLVERVRGLDYLHISVILELLLFPAFLLAPQPWLKLILVGLLGFFNSGWYAILKANLYAELPGQSGTVIALDNVAGLFGKLLPFSLGLVADSFGLNAAMWLLLAGPIALLIGLPKNMSKSQRSKV
jgi:FSR family fosmidomycin resistance protein-like MFS transporter